MSDPDPERFDRLPSAGGGIARLAFARAREAGLGLDRLLKKSGLTLREIEDRDDAPQGAEADPAAHAGRRRVAGRIFSAFGLSLEFELGEIGLLHYAMASSATLGDALQRAARYSTIANEGVALDVSRPTS